jgi:DNA-binding LacI/PurR family transcriptional regulator
MADAAFMNAHSGPKGSEGLDIRDLARHLSVSIGTVSRALNGRSGVHPDTRKRVLEAAARLNYAPNQSGRSLRKGRTHAIAFLLQPHPGAHEYGEPVFMPFMKGMQTVFAKKGLELVAVMDEPGEAQERLHRIVEAHWADAIILAWTRRIDPRIEYLTRVGFPFATLGRSNSGGNTYPSIDFDFLRAGREAVDRLAGHGHERIAVVSPSPSLNFAHLFRQGYRTGLRRNGLVLDPKLIMTGEVNEAGGYAATRTLMDRCDAPSAIIFNNDAMALGGCRALGELGLKPGSDIALIVVAGSRFTGYLSPALTSFAVELEPLGGRLAEMLLTAMPRYAGSEEPRIIREVWPLELTPRESDPPRKTILHASNAAVCANGHGTQPLGVHGNVPTAGTGDNS